MQLPIFAIRSENMFGNDEKFIMDNASNILMKTIRVPKAK
jgi:hypothetical protein